MKELIRRISNIHIPGKLPDIILFSIPRSGSTWVMQLVGSQKGFKVCSEPLDLRNPRVCKYLKTINWQNLYDNQNCTKIEQYFQKISEGRLWIHNISPFHKQYRPITRRVVYKLLHGCEPWCERLTKSLKAKSLLLLRHPVPVSLSRKQLPRLSAFVETDFAEQYTVEQLNYARKIIEKGTFFEKGVLSWCFQTSMFLKYSKTFDVIISYEQTVLDPVPVIDTLFHKLCLNDRKRIYSVLNMPSGSTFKSDQATKMVLGKASGKNRDVFLVTKWWNQVNEEQRQKAQMILDVFNIDVYKINDFLPKDCIWIDDNLKKRDEIEKELKLTVNTRTY